MPHLYFPGQQIREDSAEVAANLARKGWTILPDKPDPTATWDETGKEWVTPPPPPPEPNYTGFYDDLIAHPVYQAISMKAATFQPLAFACTEFAAALGDAKAGRPNPDAIRMSVWKLLYWLQPGAEEKAAVQQIVDKNNLEGLYSLEIPEPVLAAFEAMPNPFKFYEDILSSKIYNQKIIPLILSGESSVPGDVTTWLGFAINNAQNGLVPPPTPDGPPNSLQSALWLWMSAVGPKLDEADIAEIQGLLESANLADLYSLTPPAQP
jgi:hypothetical protein